MAVKVSAYFTVSWADSCASIFEPIFLYALIFYQGDDIITSRERHEARYQRRKAKRLKAAEKYCGKSFDEVFSFKNMTAAGKRCCNNARWKSSTINFEADLLARCKVKLDEIRSGQRKFKGFHSFAVVEHGKRRFIDSLPIDDRAIQKCLCDNILTEACSRSFIYDNSASLKYKGMDFALNRLKEHLRRHYRRHGTNGGILLFDFKSFFASLPHDKIKKRINKVIWDRQLRELLHSLIDDFKRMGQSNGSPFGVGLGSEVSQIIALDFASPIDHYIKDTCGAKGYGRYMDDGYVMSESLERLRRLLCEIREIADKCGIRLSEKKCLIIPFRHHAFHFLKMRVFLTDTGKVIMKINKKCVKAMRRKIKIFFVWVKRGKFTYSDAYQSYQSWRAHAKRSNCYRTLKNMDSHFRRVFYEICCTQAF